jgi:hypothetical protein
VHYIRNVLFWLHVPNNCVISGRYYGWTRRRCQQVLLALMHTLRRAQSDAMEIACTACCTAHVQSGGADEFLLSDFGLKLNSGAPMGSDGCILVCLQNGTLIPTSTGSLWTAVAPVPGDRFVQVRSMEEAGSGGGWIWS